MPGRRRLTHLDQVQDPVILPPKHPEAPSHVRPTTVHPLWQRPFDGWNWRERECASPTLLHRNRTQKFSTARCTTVSHLVARRRRVFCHHNLAAPSAIAVAKTILASSPVVPALQPQPRLLDCVGDDILAQSGFFVGWSPGVAVRVAANSARRWETSASNSERGVGAVGGVALSTGLLLRPPTEQDVLCLVPTKHFRQLFLLPTWRVRQIPCTQESVLPKVSRVSQLVPCAPDRTFSNLATFS